MTNTSPRYGFPAPDGTDLVISGDDAMEALRDAVEATIHPLYFTASGSNGAIPINTYARLTLTAPLARGFELSGDGTFITYTGPSGRWFHMTAGATVASTTTAESVKSLRINGNGNPAQGADSFGQREAICIATVALLNTGDTLFVDAAGGAVATTATAGYLTLLGGL